MPESITIVGDGAMATVCALLLLDKGNRVAMWGPFAEHLEQMRRDRENKRYLPGRELPQGLVLEADPAQVFVNADLVVNAIPTQYIRRVWERVGGHVGDAMPIVSVAKGIEQETLLPPTGIIAQVLGDEDGRRPLAALSGPSVADELARHLPATVCAASRDPQFARRLQHLFTTDWFRVYTNDDLVGVELAGATKNVIALAAGILDGLEVGINAKSALLARGLAEIARLGTAMGAHQETFFGLTGVGDLATTCFSPTGRNRTCGQMLGQGKSLQETLDTIPGVVEGVPTAKAVLSLASQRGIEMPITQAVHDVLFAALDPRDAITRLMTREPKAETVG